MPFLKRRRRKTVNFNQNQKAGTVLALINGKAKEKQQRPERRNNERHEKPCGEDIFIIYLATNSPLDIVLTTLQALSENDIETFISEERLIDYVSCMSDKKMFLVIDNEPSNNLLTTIETLEQIDSLFVYSSSILNNQYIENSIQTTRIINRCNNEQTLSNAIRESREGLEKQTAVFSLYNQKEKATRDISKEAGSFLFFQLFKSALMNMPQTIESKHMMLSKCRDYYRGNTNELANITEFDLTYQPKDAIQWYTRESFVYKFINKALRTEDVDVLYHFRFYIIDLCKQLELKFLELQHTQTDILKLYRGLKLSNIEITSFQQNIGNLISTNGYLSTSRLYSIAYTFAKKPTNREGLVCALFQYQIDLNQVKKIVIADISQYSAFPEEAEVLVDIGASFQIDSCIFDSNDNLWRIMVHATDQGAALANEYIEYQKKKMADANIVLMFGHLLVEMGQYNKAEKYFDTILSSNPNDEEIACIYFNLGRAYRLKGDFNRAIDYYTRAYNLHDQSKPKRRASAAKALNGLGITSCENGDHENAIKYFEKALKFLHKSVQSNHIDIAGTLLNLSSIYCEQERYDIALKNSLKAIKIYKHSLPSAHPNNALAQVVLANVYLGKGEYDAALTEYNQAMKLFETALPNDHPDVARSTHNVGLAYECQGHMEKAMYYFDQAKTIAEQTLSPKHPLINLINKSRDRLSATVESYIVTRL